MKHTGVGEAGLDEFVEQLLWDSVAGLVVFGHPLQRLLLPHPVLQHLRRSLHEIPLHVSPAEHGVVRLWTGSRLHYDLIFTMWCQIKRFELNRFKSTLRT